ncbi:MAG: RNA polymerase sigma factor [Bacteroidales bacterium]|nr:RNA polymerase sigma factor [Bacteroidales bacterium]
METKNLIESCIKKDESAFRILVDRYAGYAFSVAYRVVNDEEEAKDIVQESFIAAWNSMERFDSGRNFSNWLYRIIVNKCFDSLRRGRLKGINRTEAEHPGISRIISDSDPGKKLENKEIGRIIRLMTGKLSPKQKAVFILSALEGLSHDDISEITGMAKSSVKSNLNHAIKKIRACLEKYL